MLAHVSRIDGVEYDDTRRQDQGKMAEYFFIDVCCTVFLECEFPPSTNTSKEIDLLLKLLKLLDIK